MEGSMLTISLGIWMELPGVNYSDLTNGKRRYLSARRPKRDMNPVSISSYVCCLSPPPTPLPGI